jgi:hypothetical protein
MKMRTGFVSNSSSSSFIVAFPKRPTSVDEVEELLFGELEGEHIDDWTKKVVCTNREIAALVYGAILAQNDCGPMEEDIVKELMYYNYKGRSKPVKPYADWHDKKAVKNQDRRERRIVEKDVKKFLKDNHVWTLDSPDDDRGVVYTFEFSDSSKMGSILEHDGIFARLPHFRASKH